MSDSNNRRVLTAGWGKLARWLLGVSRGRLDETYFCIAGVHILSRSCADQLSDVRPDPDIASRALTLAEAESIRTNRDFSTVRQRLEEGFICRVAINNAGVLDQSFWLTERTYPCWPVRTIIDPGPGGKYLFDAYTPEASRRHGRYRRNLAAWLEQLDPRSGEIIAAVDAFNRRAIISHQNLGFREVARVFCVSVLGFKLFWLRLSGSVPEIRWLMRAVGKYLVLDVQRRAVH